MAIEEDGPWNLFRQDAAEPQDDYAQVSAPAGASRRPAWQADVESALETASREHGVDRNLLDTIARVESSGNPAARTGKYKGLFQLSDDEFLKHGGQGDIFDPHENAYSAAAKLRAESDGFRKQYGREPTASEIYMIHQQGVGGAAAHWANPDAPAWQNMYSTAEGRQKGPGWAKQAIWGNVPADVRRQFGHVDNITSRDFTNLWADKVARFGGGATPSGGDTPAASQRPAGLMGLGGATPLTDEDEGPTTNPLLSTSVDPDTDDDEIKDESDAEAGPMYLGGPGEQTPPWELFKKAPVAGKGGATYKTPNGTEEPWTLLKKGEPKPAESTDGVGSGFWENVRNPQQYKELAKGVIPGAISMQGTTLQGVDALGAKAQYGARNFGRKQIEVMDRVDRGETVPESEDAFGYQHMGPEDRAQARKDTTDAQAVFNPTPIQDRTLYKAGQAVQDYAKGLIPPAPGYENSTGRQLGEGLGSMVGGLPYAALGEIPAVLFFGASGAGEATQRAVEYDKKERKEGRAGLTQEQIAVAGILGVAPGTTDILPLETLLGRLPLPVPPGLHGALAKGIGRIGGQAFVEGLQEGGQQFLQNLIAREVYNPAQDLGEEVAGNTGVGAGVGALAQAGKELGAAALHITGRRGRHSGSERPPEEEAKPPITAVPEEPAKETVSPPATPEESSWLRARGFDDAAIAEMSPDERQAEIADAKAQGVKPAPASPLAQDTPTAEPVQDLVAQARDLANPDSTREGLYLPKASLDALDTKGREAVAFAIGDDKFILDNFDDKGGILVAATYEGAKEALEAKARGEEFQKIVGALTGAGKGKPANGSVVVQQRNADGAVTRESLVTPEQAAKTEKEFARAGHTVETLTPQEALSRREEMIAQQATSQDQGSRRAPVEIQTPQDIAKVVDAASSTYSPAQGEANNRRLGHAKWNGLDISIETDRNNVRRGQTEGGVEWKSRMGAPYGYFKSSLGADDMHVDVFMGPNPASDRVYVLDENDKKTEKFRQHKTFVGFDSRDQAVKAYTGSTNKSAQQIGGITEMGVDEFKDWLKDGQKTEPIAEETRPRVLSPDEIDTLVRAYEDIRQVASQDHPAVEDAAIVAEMAKELRESHGLEVDDFASAENLRQHLEAQGRPEATEGGQAVEAQANAEGRGKEQAQQGGDAVAREQAGIGERTGAVRDTQDAHERGAEPAEGARGGVEDRGPEGTRQGERGSRLEGRSRLGKGLSDLMSESGGQAKAVERMVSKETAAALLKGKEKARNFVLDRGRKSGKEFGAMVLPDGTMKPNKRLGKDTESFLHVDSTTAPEMWTGAPKSVDFHHNHPKSSSFSRADYTEAAVRPALRRTWVHGHDGSEYWAEFKADAYTLGQGYDLARDMTEKAIKKKGLQAFRYRGHLIAEMLRDAGLIDYGATLAPEDAQDRIAVLKDLVGEERWADTVEDIANLKENASGILDRGARPAGRQPGDLGAAPGEAAQARSEPAGSEGRNEPGREGAGAEGQSRPVDALVARLRDTGFKTIVEARKFAAELGIKGSNKQIDEIIETAVVAAAREVVSETASGRPAFDALVGLYGKQPNLSSRTGTSVANQAYSTPVPLAYVASRLAGVATADRVLEPTAGNGALLIEAGHGNNDGVYANELDPARAKALEDQGFNVKSEDASEPGLAKPKSADAVIMNPPFGAVKEGGQSKVFDVDGWKTTQIDHAIALQNLKAMDDDGKAVLILGGTKSEKVDERRADYRGKAKREFYARLYKGYNVTDHFTVSGDLYSKQGASWPVDVIVIDGRGQSERKLPAAQPPEILKTWDQLAEKLPNAAAGRDDLASRATDRQAGKPAEGRAEPAERNGGDRQEAVGGRSERVQPEAEGKPAAVRGERDQGEPADVGPGRGHVATESRSDRDGGRTGEQAAAEPVRSRVKREPTEAKGGQARYEPMSAAASLDTLIPVNMAEPAREAMEKVEKRRGPVDRYVAEQLGYDRKDLGDYFSAEQIDALASAIDNVERGSAFIIGDQTGIGKGRIAAGMLRYAMQRDMVPVFLTEKPDLYGDMYRDLRDIGVPEMLGREPRMFITNAGEMITLDEEALAWKQEAEEARRNGEKIPARKGKFLAGGSAAKVQDGMRKIVAGDDIADVIFTTYDQLNTVKGQDTPRRQFLARIAPRAMIVLDEAHNAGGVAKTGWESKNAVMNRADFARDLAAKAKGVMFSSATYAKRPDVMDLYARTDMGKAVDDPKDLPDLIQRGGVPMQQIVASMLAKSGQYMRRERSFDGVDYQLTPVKVDDRAYKQFSSAMQAIFRFDLEVEEFRKKWGEDKLDEMGFAKSRDEGVGSGSASSISFGSLMHNITNQMLLAIKADQTAERAIAAHKAGEKPVIALANTNESFIKDFAEGEGIRAGQPLDLDFSAVLERYLGRTLRVTVKSSEGDKTHLTIPLSDLPTSMRQEYQEALNQIKAGKWDTLPISPIDWIRYRLGKAGMSVKEVTGRQTMIDYAQAVPTYVQRPKSEQGASGKRGSIASFNGGKLDALILNRSGSTGVSMHASEKFKDQRKRRMIIAQPEGNIDTHCLDAQTEILTPEGFKGIRDAFDLVAAFDPATGVVTWQSVTGRVERPLAPNETMFGIQSPGLDIRVTDQHRMLMKHRRQSVGWRLELAGDLGSNRKGNWRIPVSGVQLPAQSCPLTDHELHFIGWVLTDGTINYQSRQIVIWQAEHQPHHDHIKACLSGCGFKYGVTENRGETQYNRTSRSIGYTISLGQWRHLQEYLDKDFPVAFENLDRRQLSVLLEALHLGDGTKFNGQPWTRRSYHIATGRKTFADRLQSLCIRRGFRANVSEQHYNQNPLYMVRIKDKVEQCVGGKNHNDGRPTFGQVPFDAGETVWCVENDVGTLITRRSGKVAFLGNCQMLGRVHRTGQVIPPAFTQIAAEIPAEARPTAVLMKKMASLNANTTGARSSAFTVESVDFINEVGDKVVADILQEDPELNEKLGGPLTFEDSGKAKTEDVARKATGRLVLLDPEVQAKFLDQVQKAYLAEIKQLDALGENPLEAKTVDLQAKTVETTELKPTQGDSPFLDAVRLEKVSAKAQGRAMPVSEVVAKVSETIKTEKPAGNEAQALASLESQGRAWGHREIERVAPLIRQQIRQDVADVSDDAKDSTRRRLEAQFQRWNDTLALVYPGARVTLGMPAGDLNAIVMSVERTGKAKQMGALGSWTVRFAVPDSMRQLDFPMSKLFPPSTPKSEDEKGATLTRAGISHSDLVDAFEEARKEGRETRYIVTGNILGGFDQTRGRGRIVNYTDDKGNLHPGILMAREFNAEKFMDNRAVRFQNAGQIVEFMDKAPTAKVESNQGDIELSQYRSEFRIDMAAARAKAGQFFTDKAVRGAIAPVEFQKRGNRMIADGLSQAQFTKVLAEMQKIGAKFEVRDQQDLAQSIVAKRLQGDAIDEFASSVNNLKSRLGVKTRQRGFNEESEDAARDDDKATDLLQTVAAIKKGSRIAVVEKYAVTFGADANEIITAVEKSANIDIKAASAPELQRYIVALEDMVQIIENRLQHGYKLSEDVQTLAGVLSSRLSDASDRMDKIKEAAEESAARLTEMADALDERFEALLDDRFGDDDAARETWVERDTGRALTDPSVDKFWEGGPVHDENASFLDIVDEEARYGEHLLAGHESEVQRLLAIEPEKLTIEQVEAAYSAVGDALMRSYRLEKWFDRMSSDTYARSGEAYDTIHEIHDKKITPEIERLESAQEKIAERIDDVDAAMSGFEEEVEPTMFAVKSPVETSAALPSGDFKSAIPDIRRAMGSILKSGRPVSIKSELVDAVHSAVGAAYRMVPEGTRVFALTRVEPTGEGDKVIGTFEDRDGAVSRVKLPWLSLSGMRAFYLNGNIHFIRLNARSLRAAGEFDSHVAAELGHEVVHALHRGGVLTGSVWGRLLAHAKTLRLLDTDFGTYAKIVGDPSADLAPDVTVRETYEQYYSTRPNPAEMLDEEEVAHMMEWYLRGQLSREEVGPVQDILDAIERGEVAAISEASRLEDEMAFAVSQTALEQKRELDRLGYYSQALEAAKNLKQAKGTPEQMRAQLRSAGVKEAELKATGLDTWLAERARAVSGEEAGRSSQQALPPEVWGPRFQALMSSEYKRAVAGDDLSTQLDILSAKYFNAPNDPPAMRAAIGQEILRLRAELGPEWMAKYAPDAPPITPLLPSLQAPGNGDRTVGSPQNRRSREPIVTKDEIVSFLRENRVQVKEEVYGSQTMSDAQIDRVVRNTGYRTREALADRMGVPVGQLGEAIIREYGPPSEAKTRWSSYSIDPSNPTYRETVIHLPTKPQTDADLNARAMKAFGKPFSEIPVSEQAYLRATGESQENPNAFRGGHWDEPNVIAHARTSLQKDSAGKTVFLIDELQSDWGQKLRDGGVRDEEKIAELNAKVDASLDAMQSAPAKAWREEVARFGRDRGLNTGSSGDHVDIVKNLKRLASRKDAVGTEAGSLLGQDPIPGVAERFDLERAELSTATAAAPGHPLVNTTDQWTTTAFRRLIRQAVEAGADAIALTPGKVQNERFNLAKQVSALAYEPSRGQLYYKRANESSSYHWTSLASGVWREDLPNYVGKEMAERLLSEPLDKSVAGPAPGDGRGAWHVLDDLSSVEIGGSGMKATYDSIYPRTLSKLLAKMDASAGKMSDAPLSSSVDGRAFMPKMDHATTAVLAESGHDVSAAMASAKARLVEAEREPTILKETALGKQKREENVARLRRIISELDAAKPIPFHTFPLTDKVKEAVMEDGQPMFAIGAGASGVSTLSGGVQQAVSRDISEAINIVNRIAGPTVSVQFADQIDAVTVSGEQREATVRAGFDGKTAGGFYRPAKVDASALIGLATGDPNFDLLTTAGHEAWHHVETALATDAEKKLLSSPSELRRMRAVAGEEIGLSSGDPRLDALPDTEIRAIAFQKYRREREEGMQPAGMHIGLRRFWDRVLKVFAAVRNALAGHGLKTYEDVFETARSGEIASRSNELGSPPARNSDTFQQGEGASAPSTVSGVSLDMSPEARKARAEAMGFDTSRVWYHGTPATFDGFDLSRLGNGFNSLGVFFSSERAQAQTRAATARSDGNIVEAYVRGVMPVLDLSQFAGHYGVWQREVRSAAEKARKDGAAGVVVHEAATAYEPASDMAIVFDPANIRSVDAAFDPAETDSATLMASLIPRVVQQSVNRTMARLQVRDRTDRLRVGLQDKFLPVRRVQEEKERQSGTKVPINLDTYVAEALYHGRAGEQTADLQADYIEPLVDILRTNDISKEDFDSYLYARHAAERNAEIAKIDPTNTEGSGMSNAEASRILTAAASKQSAYDVAAKLVDDMIAETRNRLLQSGLITRETYDQWESKFAHYVPLRGFEAGSDESDRARSGRGFDIRGPEAMQALGRRSKADSPLAYSLLQAQQAIVRSEKNRVDKTLYRFIQAYPDPSLYKVYKGEYRRKLNPTTNQVESYWVAPHFVRDDAIHGVKIGGKQYYMELKDPGLARAMRGVQGDRQNAVLRGMMWLSRTYATLLTSYNPEFVVSNFLRDMQTAMLNVTDVAGKPEGVRRQMVKDALSLKSIRGVMNALRGDGSTEYAKWFEEYRQAGGKISFMEFNDVERIQRDVTKSIERGRFRRVASKAFDLVNDLNSAVENGVRLSTYIAMRKGGIEKDRAAFVARELTVNFNRKGEWSPVINSMYLFFNASVQGTVRMMQAVGKSRTLQVAVASIMGAAFMVDWWNYLAAGDDDDGKNRYDKIPDWIKERNLIIMTGRKDGAYVQIPMPYGYNLFWLGGQQTGAVIRGAVPPHKAALNVGKAILEVLSPIGGANGSLAQMVAPTMVDPFVQVIENKTWYGGPIYPTKWNKHQPDSETFFSSVNPFFVKLARTLNSVSGGNTARSGALDISPEVLEHFAEFAGGGVAKFFLNAQTAGSRAINGEEWLPEKTPFIRRVYGKATTESRRRDFYEAWNEIDAAKYEVDNLIKNVRKGTADRDEIAAAREKYKPELQAYEQMRGVQRQLSAMRKQRTTIELDPKLERREKEERIKELTNRENGIILQGLGNLNRIRKQSKQPAEPATQE